MILYLDVVSSIPEFSIIEDNKIIFSTKIIHSVDEKLSDNIIPKYLEMNKSFKFLKTKDLEQAKKIFQKHLCSFIPVVNSNMILQDLITLDQFLSEI